MRFRVCNSSFVASYYLVEGNLKTEYNVVAIGGGRGLAQVLKGLKWIPGIKITGICGNTDDGGKTKKAIEEYGAFSYLGDLTRGIIALCPDETFAEAMDYRFDSKSLEGWTPRHVLQLAFEKIFPDDLDAALAHMWALCGLGNHRVIPVTRERVKLLVHFHRVGNQLEEEANLDTITRNPLWHPHLHEIKDIFLKPEARISEMARCAIRDAHFIIICPGSFYGSILATLLPKGIIGTFAESSAKILFFPNAVREVGPTYDWTTSDFLDKLVRAIGKSPDRIIFDPDIQEDRKISLGELRHERKSRFATSRVMRALAMATVDDHGMYCHEPIAIGAVFSKVLREFGCIPSEEPALVSSAATS